MNTILIFIIVCLGVFNLVHLLSITNSSNPKTTTPLPNPIFRIGTDVDTDAGTLVVVSVNDGFFDFFENWKHHANKVGIKDYDILVVAEDEKVYDKLNNISPLIAVQQSSYSMSPQSHKYNSKQYIKMVSRRPQYLLSILKSQNRNVLYMDVDTVLLKDIRKLYDDTDDMVFGIDATNVMGVENYYCTGIMYFRNCNDSLKVLTKWNDVIQKNNQLNQPLFNKILRTVGVKHRPFDKYQVMSGKTLRESGIKPDTALIHANYVQGKDKKIAMLSSHGFWINKTNVSICTCVRSRKSDKRVEELDIHRHLIKSIEDTVTKEERRKYNIKIYIYYDDDDDFWIKNSDYDWSSVTEFPVFMFMTPHTDRIPWNEVTKKAFDEGGEYFFRTNDDVVMQSSRWVDLAVNRLKGMNNVGVVGPKSLKGNTQILTLDFTHRSHLEIFDDYYPPEFKNWYVDDFITYVYNERLQVIPEWKALHLVKETRYSVFSPSKTVYRKLMAKGKRLINDYLNSKNISIIVAGDSTLSCVTPGVKMPNYFDYWVECNIPHEDVCENYIFKHHILPTRENKFLSNTTTINGCRITPRSVFNMKERGITTTKHIQTQTTY